MFLDMVVEVVNGKLETSIYHKPQALHLYLPPHSCHAPGFVYGLVCRIVLRIYSLCSRAKNIDDELVSLFGYLVDRGHQSTDLVPLFCKAMANATPFVRGGSKRRRKLVGEGSFFTCLITPRILLPV